MKKLLALSVLVFLVAECGMLPRKTAAPPASAPPGKKAPDASPHSTAGSIADAAYSGGSAALQEGRPERALELFADAWKEAPGHPGVEQDFAGALELLKKTGDHAEQKEDFAGAGKAWTASLSYLSHPAAKGKSLSFTRSDLKGNLDRLSRKLMDKGLVEYREGRFEAAISWWQKILAYDPANEEAAKSVRTATTQLENLKKITPGK